MLGHTCGRQVVMMTMYALIMDVVPLLMLLATVMMGGLVPLVNIKLVI